MRHYAVSTLLLAVLFSATTGYDKYADALAKYKKWAEQYGGLKVEQLAGGGVRSERQTRREDIFVPHRPSTDGGRQYPAIDVTKSLFAEFESGSPNLVRDTRNPLSNEIQSGLGGSEFVSSGVPLYKLRKRYPHGYGRRRRSAEPQGWVLLDPSTGRPLADTKSGNGNRQFSEGSQSPFSEQEEQSPSVIRGARNPSQGVSDYVVNGVPLYKLRSQNPQGYGRKRRSADPQGWALLDPNTGRPIESGDGFPSVVRKERRQGSEGEFSEFYNQEQRYVDNEGNAAPIYKYYKKYPYSG